MHSAERTLIEQKVRSSLRHEVAVDTATARIMGMGARSALTCSSVKMRVERAATHGILRIAAQALDRLLQRFTCFAFFGRNVERAIDLGCALHLAA